MTARVLALALVLATLGCAGPAPAPRPAPAPTPPPAPEPPPTEPTPAPQPDLPDFRSTEEWQDDTAGVVATLVYVTEKGSRANPQPAAIVLSSDPENPHFTRKNTARVTVQKLTKEDMGGLLGELGQLGFHRLPWAAQPYDAEIGPERALYLYREGKRFRVQKHALGGDDPTTFTAIERKVIDRTMREERR